MGAPAGASTPAAGPPQHGRMPPPTQAPRPHDAEARHTRLEALLRTRLATKLPGLAATQRKYRLLLAGLVVAAVLLLGFGIGLDVVGLLMLGAMAGMASLLALRHGAGTFHDQVRSALTPLVCEAIGGISHSVGAAQPVLQLLERVPLVRPFAHTTIDDVFTGSHDGTCFVMAEARLFNRTTSSTSSGTKRTTTTTEKTVFKGLVFLIETRHPVPARILLRGPVGWFGPGWRHGPKALAAQGFARVEVPDPAFARHLSLWTDEPEWTDEPGAALRVVGPGLAATLARLAATAGRRRIDAAFVASHFALLLPKGGNAFAVGGLFRNLGRLAPDAHALLDEIMVVHRLIDLLTQPAPAT
jgi:hypothetical protein